MDYRKMVETVGKLYGLSEDPPTVRARIVKRQPATVPQKRSGSDPAPETDPELGPVEQALALMVANPQMTVTKIAKIVRCNRGTLYRDPRFKMARQVLRKTRANDAEQSRRRLPRGDKSDGCLEAWET